MALIAVHLNAGVILVVTGSMVQFCFTSTETTGLIRDTEPRTTTSTFTQLLSSELVVTV